MYNFFVTLSKQIIEIYLREIFLSLESQQMLSNKYKNKQKKV